MTPSLYDLLDVDPDASEGRIRRAWRAAIADLDPTDRRFRAYNRAAEVLLDPERRAEHDALLAAEAEEDAAPAEETPVAAPVVTEAPAPKKATAKKAPEKKAPAKKPAAKKPAATTTTAATAKTVPAATATEKKTPAAKAPVKKTPVKKAPARARRPVPTWVLAAVGVLTLAVVAATVFFGFVQDSGSAAAPDEAAAAEKAAVSAAVPVLSYDYRKLDDDEATATSYMTDDYAKQYSDLFDTLSQNATQQQAVVDAQVMASGITRTGDGRVDVLVFVNQVITKKTSDEPFTLKMWATMSMVDQGGDWLVDQLVVDTAPAA